MWKRGGKVKIQSYVTIGRVCNYVVPIYVYFIQFHLCIFMKIVRFLYRDIFPFSLSTLL